MNRMSLYPMRFEPMYQYRLWGGRRLAELLGKPLPNDGPFGEAWLLSDREDHQSLVADGPLQGHSIGQLMAQFPDALMGKLAHRFERFPLLLKFLDVREMLSVQVHSGYTRAGATTAVENAKTEAWVVLEAGPESRIYARLKPGLTAETLRIALSEGTLVDRLAMLKPQVADAVFLPAGTVHSLGDDVIVFEIQQNSDVTYRLYDWDHVDTETGKPRPLQVDQAIACIDFASDSAGLVVPVLEAAAPVKREKLFNCAYFCLWRFRGKVPFFVGAADMPRVLVCIEGSGQLQSGEVSYAVEKGSVWLLPAVAGLCEFKPDGLVTVLEAAIPE